MIEALGLAMMISTRCKKEGRDAAIAGEKYQDCPYKDELERAAWLDGWSKQAAQEK